MGLNWFDFARKEDIAGWRLHQEAEEAYIQSVGWEGTWVKVPRKWHLLIDNRIGHESFSHLWNGFEWVPVVSYDRKGKLYIRLPHPCEVKK